MIRPLDAYVDHETMLDRYGLAYVCRHPEILFNLPTQPRADPFSRNRWADFGPRRNAFHTDYGSGRAAYIGDLVLRAVEAYRILEELYAPYRPDHKGDARL